MPRIPKIVSEVGDALAEISHLIKVWGFPIPKMSDAARFETVIGYCEGLTVQPKTVEDLAFREAWRPRIRDAARHSGHSLRTAADQLHFAVSCGFTLRQLLRLAEDGWLLDVVDAANEFRPTTEGQVEMIDEVWDSIRERAGS